MANDYVPDINVGKIESDDLISREKAKQFLYERLDRLNDDELYDIFSRIIDDMYNELPSITPKAKMGRWIFHKPFDNGRKNCNECIECSQCHTWFGYAKTPYCPNCGAKMQEVEE